MHGAPPPSMREVAVRGAPSVLCMVSKWGGPLRMIYTHTHLSTSTDAESFAMGSNLHLVSHLPAAATVAPLAVQDGVPCMLFVQFQCLEKYWVTQCLSLSL